MPPGGPTKGSRRPSGCARRTRDVGVVVLSQYAEPRYALALLEGGTAGRAYLLKERVEDIEQLVAAIRAVADGGSVIDPKVVEALVADKTRPEASPLHELTPRERDVLREMAEGKNNAAIAQALFLTERSVEKVIHSIFLKLGLGWETSVHKRVKAVILYLADPDEVEPASQSSRSTVPARSRTCGRTPQRRTPALRAADPPPGRSRGGSSSSRDARPRSSAPPRCRRCRPS